MSKEETKLALTNNKTEVAIPDAANLRAVATDLLNSKLYPQFENPSQAMAAILTGREIGLGPAASLQYMAPVKGRLCAEAKVFLALFHRSGGVTHVIERNKNKCVIRFSKPGREDHLQEYTYEMAVAEGLTGKDNWKRMTETMLFNRCVANGIRAFEPGVIMGLAMTKDEAEDYLGADFSEKPDGARVEEVKEEKRKGRPRKAEAAAPPVVIETQAVSQPEPERVPATEPGSKYVTMDIPEVTPKKVTVAAPVKEAGGFDDFASMSQDASDDFIEGLKAAIAERGVELKPFKAWLYEFQGKFKNKRSFVVKLGAAIRFHGGDKEDQEYLLKQLDAAIVVYQNEMEKKNNG